MLYLAVEYVSMSRELILNCAKEYYKEIGTSRTYYVVT